jgi:ADP-heptose:LPS heptosyltransferase
LVTDGVRAIWRLRKEGLDATIDMDFFSRSSAIVAFLVCRHHRVGFHRYTNEGLGRGNLLTHPVLYSAQVHTSIAFLALARALMEPRKPLPLYKASLTISEEDLPTYRPSAELIRAVRQAMTSAGLPELRGSSKLILVNPNSSDLFPLRRWPMPYFVEFCQRLLQARPGASIVVTGSASEIPDADQIVKQASHPRCVSLAGKTSFPELLALHSIADLLITNDSGPAHFASLVRLPTIALFGPETPQLYKPLGNACIALYAGFACSPCVSAYNNKKSPCTDNRCLQAITPQTVLLEALKVLDGGSVNR